MPWIIFAAIIWILNVLFIRPYELKKHWSVGAWSLLVGFFVTEALVFQGVISFHEGLYLFQEIPIAYIIGVSGLGLMIIRFLPSDKLWKLLYLIFVTGVLTWVEVIFINNGYLTIEPWSLYYSFFIKLFTLVCIAWLSHLTIRQSKGYLF